MIADNIKEFLQNPGGVDLKAVRHGISIARRTMKKSMENYQHQNNRLYASAISFRCERKCAYRYYGVEGEEKQESFYLNVSLGGLVEAWVIAMAKASGLNIKPAPKLSFHIDQAHSETVIPDALLRTENGSWNVEVKKVSRYTFKEYEAWNSFQGTIGMEDAKEPPDLDAWGYRTQMALECIGWINAGKKIKGSILVYVQAENPVDIGEIVLPFTDEEEDLAKIAITRARKVLASQRPEDLPKAFAPVPETYRRAETGRMKLPFQCSYCDYKQSCFPEAKLDFKAKRPVWVIGGQNGKNSME